jgi:hypothetical protein
MRRHQRTYYKRGLVKLKAPYKRKLQRAVERDLLRDDAPLVVPVDSGRGPVMPITFIGDHWRALVRISC